MRSDRTDPSSLTQAFHDPVVAQAETSEQAKLPDLSFLDPSEAPGELGRLAQYRVIRIIGEGGMGVVFEAEDLHLQRRVALKVMKPELAASLAGRTRFLREARAAAAITSDYVVTIFQVGQGNDVPYLAMQLLQGETLEARLAREGRLTPFDALVIAAQTAAGLSAAHEKGLVHRDIKPGNLWLESDQPGGSFRRVRILDLGLVGGIGTGPKSTTVGVIVGTPHYMAPEQAAGDAVDGRADLFSLGCVLYTMLSGELAFPGPSTMAVLMALASRTPPVLSSLVPSVSPELSDVVARLMSKSPEDRPGSSAEALEIFENLLEVERSKLPPETDTRARASGTVGWPLRREPSSSSNASARLASPPETRSNYRGPSAVDTPPPPAVPDSSSSVMTPPTRSSSNRRWLGIAIGFVILAVLGGFGILSNRKRENHTPPVENVLEPIHVGILHSQSGTMAVSESPVIDATLLAIDEINAAGGIQGRLLKPIIVDGRSDPEEFARSAEKLLTEDRVAVIFGCWTSASRKAVRPVVERHQGLLFYPVQYEGLEQSPRIVYTGPAPNQQLLPAIDYLTNNLGKKKLFHVGSDYVFPRTAHEIIKDRVKELPGVAIVGEYFIPLGSPNVAEAVRKIVEAQPDAILNTVNGGTNVHLFRELRAAGITAAKVRTLSVSITENEVEGLNPASLAGDLLAASYFQSVTRKESQEFMRKFRQQYGADRVVSDAMAAAYSGVHLWANSSQDAGSVDPTSVLGAIRGRTFDGPRAKVQVDAENLHTWLPVRIGVIQEDGQISILSDASTSETIPPIPFPTSRSRPQWEQLLRSLQFEWDGKWQPPVRQ